MALWFLLQAPASLPDLFWVVLTAALSLLVAGAGLCGRLMWVVITLRLAALEKDIAALSKEIAGLREWQRDREP